MPEKALEIISLNDPARFGLESDVLRVGDKIIEVAGEAADDQLDFHFHTSDADKSVVIKVERAGGDIEELELPAEAIAGMEIYFRAMDFRRCRCKCPFCFVDQMPAGMRDSLYVKDEDFRLSFLYGNFTTMNDVTDAELDKIIAQKNSPQWVSVHVIEEEMRRFIFGRPMKRRITDTLSRLAEGGIKVHTQAVIVPGKNDGEYLRDTIETLEGLHENISTLAVVPVGLTKHRAGLPGIRAYNDAEMPAVLDLVEPYRRRFLAGPRRSRFVFPSDEWYVGANRAVPSSDDYEGFPQLDNGVGSIRQLMDDLEADLEAMGVPSDLSHVRIATGTLGERVFERYVMPALAAAGVSHPPQIVSVENRFFGATVTCSGLLIGADICEAVAVEGRRGTVTLIPPNCLNHDGVTIDEMRPEDMAARIGATVVVPGESLVETLNAYAKDRRFRA